MHNLLYRLMSEHCPQQAAECKGRFEKIERRNWVNKAASFAGGIIGGFVAITSKWLITGK
jgi:hypothetical protein